MRHFFKAIPNVAALLLLTTQASAHDTWVNTNTAVVRTGDVIHADLRLGNLGNNHRDFKLSGIVDPAWVTFDVVGPDGTVTSLKDRMSSTARDEKQGYWTTTFVPKSPGVYCVSHEIDRVMQHTRAVHAIRTAKAVFTAADSLDKPVCGMNASKPIGLPIELVVKSCILNSTVAGQTVKVQLLLHGHPLSNTVVSFIPQGTELAEGFDPLHERKTDENGFATFTPAQGNLYLVVAHHDAEDEKSNEYDYTSYATTLTLHMAQIPR
ncbi:DUF4198 domain-containing protein [Novipirellula artificiosorum]|uniref:Nickel uptake substrate-specific transmembrane region n=1 Tax=Novipirellula artificiosorum TaxID=2528016 RepID=A0A5C6DC82_9BACT|nr:DUF4198 domain-containing protein [Novipirellula artificiosorum]TWU34370.1 Nickel uptake substrate-specific transmembrane region [Novipirellula artificiosorum]